VRGSHRAPTGQYRTGSRKFLVSDRRPESPWTGVSLRPSSRGSIHRRRVRANRLTRRSLRFQHGIRSRAGEAERARFTDGPRRLHVDAWRNRLVRLFRPFACTDGKGETGQERERPARESHGSESTGGCSLGSESLIDDIQRSDFAQAAFLLAGVKALHQDVLCGAGSGKRRLRSLRERGDVPHLSARPGL
jgi:hypothetical protein